jgi:hypothetical protein
MRRSFAAGTAARLAGWRGYTLTELLVTVGFVVVLVAMVVIAVLTALPALQARWAPSPRTPEPMPRRVSAAPAPRASFERLRAEAVARLESSDWAGARLALEEALRVRPADLYTRYLLGVALSNLDLQDHAAEAFAWVVAYGSPRFEYVGLARQWLVLAGLLRGPATATAAERESAQPVGRVRGRTSRVPIDDGEATLSLALEGTGATTAGRRYSASAPANEDYEFPSVVPGEYRLTVRRGDARLWDVPIVVGAEGPTTVDLGPAEAAPAALHPRDS